jgi:hypothetical protein
MILMPVWLIGGAALLLLLIGKKISKKWEAKMVPPTPIKVGDGSLYVVSRDLDPNDISSSNSGKWHTDPSLPFRLVSPYTNAQVVSVTFWIKGQPRTTTACAAGPCWVTVNYGSANLRVYPDNGVLVMDWDDGLGGDWSAWQPGKDPDDNTTPASEFGSSSLITHIALTSNAVYARPAGNTQKVRVQINFA